MAVPEGFEEVKAHLLDIIYSRSVLIKPEIAMKVGCRAVPACCLHRLRAEAKPCRTL